MAVVIANRLIFAGLAYQGVGSTAISGRNVTNWEFLLPRFLVIVCLRRGRPASNVGTVSAERPAQPL
jgi:hypothetical protein